MSCYLCGHQEYLNVLQASEVAIWSNAGDGQGVRKKYKCLLRQCTKCKHVYQPLDETLKKLLTELYQSDYAQASTAVGAGNWGRERAQPIFSAMPTANLDSVLEIGCAGGEVLHYLKKRGARHLVGIEPSLSADREQEGVRFVKAFAGSSLELQETFDLVVALGVFEHIENIPDVLTFCRTHLKNYGILFFTVPDVGQFLRRGDPGLFLHQHVHYYTEATLRRLLQEYGFGVKSWQSQNDMFLISAVLGQAEPSPTAGAESYQDYAEQLAFGLERIGKVFGKGRVIVHGANNTLNNILGWLGQDFDFTLADNDTAKQGELFFGRRVKAFQELDLSQYETLFISTGSFFEPIRDQYRRAGFVGAIEGTQTGFC